MFFSSQVSSPRKYSNAQIETFSLILHHDENPVFLENLLFWEIFD